MLIRLVYKGRTSTSNPIVVVNRRNNLKESIHKADSNGLKVGSVDRVQSNPILIVNHEKNNLREAIHEVVSKWFKGRISVEKPVITLGNQPIY